MRVRGLVVAALTIMVLLAGCTGTPTPPSSPPEVAEEASGPTSSARDTPDAAGLEWVEYVSPIGDFRIEHPTTWDVEDIDGMRVGLISPRDPADDADFRENVIVTSYANVRNRNLTALLNHTLTSLNSMHEDIVIVRTMLEEHDDPPWFGIALNTTHDGQRLRQDLVVTPAGPFVYELTFTASPDGGELWRTEWLHFLKSFHVLQIQPTMTVTNDDHAPSAVQILFKNTGMESVYVHHGAFQLVDADGVVYPVDPRVTYAAGADALPNGVTLAPGRSVRGHLGFAAFDGAPPPWTLEYQRDWAYSAVEFGPPASPEPEAPR